MVVKIKDHSEFDAVYELIIDLDFVDGEEKWEKGTQFGRKEKVVWSPNDESNKHGKIWPFVSEVFDRETVFKKIK